MLISNDYFGQPSVLEKNRAAMLKAMSHTFDADCCERLADAFFESVNTDDEPYDKIGRALMQIYVSCSDEQASAVDSVLAALCGWSMNSLLKKAELIEDDDCMFHEIPTPPRYAAAKEQSQPASDSRYSADLVATYEELMNVPGEDQLTAYFGEYGLHHFKDGVTEKEIRPVYDKALVAIEMTEEEFNARHSQFAYRSEIIGRMRNCLLPSVLKTGEEYLFVATEPYGGDGDFALCGGILLSVDTDQKTCTMRGGFFTMEDVPLRYILARHNPEVTGKHYGFAKAEPLFGEYPALAQHYLKDAEEAFHEKWTSVQEQDEEPMQAIGEGV